MERKNKKYDDITRPIYDITLNEYNSDINRSRSIDARAGIFLTFLITGFPIYIQITNLQYLHNLLHAHYLTINQCLLIIGFFASIAIFIVAIIFVILTLSTRAFKVFSLDINTINLIEYEDNDTTINEITLSVLAVLQELIEYNRKVVENKAKLFKFSLWSLFAFVALMIFTIIMIVI